MSGTSTVTSILRAYNRDLESLCGVVARWIDTDQAEDNLLAKTCLEAARVVAYQRAFLLPLLGDVADDADLVRGDEQRLDAILAAARALEEAPTGKASREPVRALGRAAADLRAAQDERTFPLLEQRLGLDVLADIGARVTPTMEPGTTHSHPSALKGFAGAGWPRPGWTDAAYEAFVAEVRNREPDVAFHLPHTPG